jgi:signal transduction histidine kinase
MTEMGGMIWLESEGTGKGTTFIMSFPLRENNAA